VSVERRIPVLRIEPAASCTLAAVLTLAHVVACASLFVAIPQWHGRLLAALVLGVNAWWVVQRHALRGAPGAAVRLDFQGESDCTLLCRDGSRLECRVLGSSFVTTWLVVLHLREPRGRLTRYVVLLPDSVGPERLRRLRVRLRWTSVESPALAGKDPSL
jgi:toxin CptA